MEIQSLSIVVPTKGCVNDCKFCVSKMHTNDYENNFDVIQYRKRIKYAKNHNINTLIITGTGEPLQNKVFLNNLCDVLNKEHHPFPNVELQTTGVMLMNSNEAFLNKKHPKIIYDNMSILKSLGVNTISLSVSDIFDSNNNNKLIGVLDNLQFELEDLCNFIKSQKFNLRLSLNMTNVYDKLYPEDILMRCKELKADQITFRRLYGGGIDTPESIWVDENSCDEKVIKMINEYISGSPQMEACSADGFMHPTGSWNEGEGVPLYKLPFGPIVFSIDGISVAIDDDCMSKDNIDTLKYVILRENGKLYCRWDDEGSLIF